MKGTFEDQILGIVRKDPRYDREAYFFIFEALDFSITKIGEKRHMNGRELLEGIRELAVAKFGLLARSVFSNWGAYKTEDFGEMVFNLVEAGLLSRTDEDSKEDFADGFSFNEVFGNIPVNVTIEKRKK